MHIKKALNLYIFLFFLIIAFSLFGFNSFIGFLILVELTTVTFIVVLIFNFSNFFNYVVKLKKYYFILLILVVAYFDKSYSLLFLNASEYFSYYLLYLFPIWNDFIGIYLYIFYDNSFFMIAVGLCFFFITIGLIFIFKLIFIKKIFNISQLQIKFLKNLKKHYINFFSKYNFWESLEKSIISKFRK